MSRKEFDTPHQVKGKPAKSRFGLRKTTKTASQEENTPGFKYANPGRGQGGESSN